MRGNLAVSQLVEGGTQSFATYSYSPVVHYASPTAHNFTTSNTEKIVTGRLKRLRNALFVVNKFLGAAKTTFNGTNGRYI